MTTMTSKRKSSGFCNQELLMCKKLKIEEERLKQSRIHKLETYSSILNVRNLFPTKRYHEKIPKIVLLHQLYDHGSSRTIVDREVKSMQLAGTVCAFNLAAVEKMELKALILMEDFIKTTQICYPDNILLQTFLETIKTIGVAEISKSYMGSHFTNKEISEIMHSGYLVFSTEESYHLSFPNAGHFMKAYLRGRKAILQTIKKCKHGEILQNELLDRNMQKAVPLGIMYHIHDVVGSDLVAAVDTPSGRILRLKK